jgi:hypothetical protein
MLKGGCEFTRGLIEFVPIVGFLFTAQFINPPGRIGTHGEIVQNWWILKIHNPDQRELVVDPEPIWSPEVLARPISFSVK